MLMHRHPGVNPAVVFRGVGGHHTNRTPPMPSSLPRLPTRRNPLNQRNITATHARPLTVTTGRSRTL